MTTTRRVSAALLDVLAAIDTAPAGIHGYQIIKDLSADDPARSATVYGHLRRLESDHWVTSTWETPAGGRPPRRVYRFTDIGRLKARALLARRRGHAA